MVKVLFQLEPGAWHGSAAETVWAERVDERRFRLRNVPFFAFGVGVDDVVFAHARNETFEFEGVSIRAGHSAYRLIVNAACTPEQFRRKWQRLERSGCTYEHGPGSLRAVDVPPDADIHKVYALLEEGERDGTWTFEEGHCGHDVSS